MRIEKWREPLGKLKVNGQMLELYRFKRMVILSDGRHCDDQVIAHLKDGKYYEFENGSLPFDIRHAKAIGEHVVVRGESEPEQHREPDESTHEEKIEARRKRVQKAIDDFEESRKKKKEDPTPKQLPLDFPF